MTAISQQRKIFLKYYKNGARSHVYLQRKTKLSLSTIKKYIQNLKEKKPIVQNKCGRPCKIKGRETKSLITKIRHNPQLSTAKLGVIYNCSNKTIQKKLKSLNYKKRCPRKTCSVPRTDNHVRLQWAKQHLMDNWNFTIFCDESCAQLQANTVRLWCRRGARLYKSVPKDKTKVMFWGGFAKNRKFPLIFIDGKLDSVKYCKIIQQNLLANAKKWFGDGYRLLHDNDPKHRSKYTTKWMANKNVNTINPPPYSPQFNPIENLWRIVKLNVEKKSPKNLEELKKLLVEEWEKITNETLKNLVNSMQSRLQKTIEVKGSLIKY